MTRRLLTAAGVTAMFALGVTPLAIPRGNDHGSPKTGHIGICHHTGHSRAHTFIFIAPDASGVFDGHGKLKHQFADDIIPAFTFVNAHGQTLSFPGLNLATLYNGVPGAVLLANKCQRPTTTTTGSTTTGATTTGATTTGSTTTGSTTTGATTTVVTTTVVTTTPGGISTATVTLPATTVTTPARTVTNGSTVTVVKAKKTPPKVKKAKKAPPKVMKKLSSHKSPRGLTG